MLHRHRSPTSHTKKKLLLDSAWQQKYKELSLDICLEAAALLQLLLAQPSLDRLSSELAVGANTRCQPQTCNSQNIDESRGNVVN